MPFLNLLMSSLIPKYNILKEIVNRENIIELPEISSKNCIFYLKS